MKTKYVFPAVFEPEEDGVFSVYFPDVEGCYTQGDDIEEALYNAEDVLSLMLYGMEERKEPIPRPSSIASIEAELPEGHFASLVKCDTITYRKKFHSKAVRKTLTIPEWLNDIAEREDVNFSSVLQSALKSTLGVDTTM